MSRLFRTALSLESKQEEVVLNPVETELALESATLEITEATHEVQMAELTQEELEHAHSSLESIAISLEGLMAKDERGLDRVSAEGYQHAVAAILGDSLPNPVTSLESFGGESECAAATQLSLEGIKDTAKKIWDGIKRAIENAMRTLADFFAKLFGGVKKLQDRIASMKTEVAELKRSGAKAKDEFKVPGVDAIHLGGKVDAGVIQKGAKVVMSDVASGADELQALAEDYYKGLVDFYQKSDKAEDLEKVNDKTNEQISKFKLRTAELPGGKAFEVDMDDSKKGVGVPKLVDASNAKAPSGDVTMKPLDLGAIDGLLTEAAKLASEMAKKKSRRENLKKAREDVMKAADKFVEGSEKNLGDSWNQAKLNWALRSANRDFASTIGRVDGYVFKYVRALLSVLGAAMGAYGEASQEERAEDAGEGEGEGSGEGEGEGNEENDEE